MVARLPLACELVERPGLQHRPVAVIRPDDGLLWSVSPEAAAEGVEEGQRVSEAVGRCPSLVVLDGRPALYEEVHREMVEALERVVPTVEEAELGVAYADLAGLSRSYSSAVGKVWELGEALLECAPAELRSCLGVGPSKFVARLAASQTNWTGDRTRIVAAGEVDRFMAPLPVEVVPVAAEMVRRLRLVGITTVGQLAGVPQRVLVAQFGPEGRWLAGLLRGEVEPVVARPPVERVEERLALDEPLTSRPAVLAAGAHLVGRVVRHPRLGARVARQVVVRAVTEQGRVWGSTVTLREPRRDQEGVWVAVAPVLERAELPGPVSELEVGLAELRPEQGWQTELEMLGGRRGRALRRERLEEALRQLRARYGRCLVGKMVPVEPQNRLPERRWALVELD